MLFTTLSACMTVRAASVTFSGDIAPIVYAQCAECYRAGQSAPFSLTSSLPKGTRLDGQVTWDNSAQNPHNPSNPPIPITWGEQSKDEMGAVSLQFYPRNENDLKTLLADYRKHTRDVAIPRLMSDAELRKWVLAKLGAGMGAQ